MISVTLRYGLTKRIDIEIFEGTSIRDIVGNANNRAVLGYPENVSAVVDGVTLSPDDTLSDGDVVILEKQAASKA